MKDSTFNLHSERGSAAMKFLIILLVLIMIGHAGMNYIPVAYNGAAFKQEMDTAVVKGLAASGRIKPLDAVKAHLQRAASDYQVPPDALIDVTPVDGHITAHASYQTTVNILPFGIYKYNYRFEYTAVPTGYLLKE